MTASKPNPRSVVGRIKTSYPRIQQLLVPLDFSGKSRQALRYATPLAQKFSARIHLVHVLKVPRNTPQAELARLKFAALKRLGEMSTLLPARLRGGNAVLQGDPAHAILELAEKNNVDLIVLTTKGLGGLKRAVMGSTAEQVTRLAHCPVMSIRRR